MSASLVGSEMCIRDRPSEFPRSALRRALVNFASDQRPREASNSRVAVSYTHLTLPTICSV
eukprot:5640396-Alexandrium_andersonii.AAC.1